jgi:hypothetical protein
MADRLCTCGHTMQDHFCDDGVCMVDYCRCLGFEDPLSPDPEDVEDGEWEEEPEDQRLRREGYAQLPGIEEAS